MGSDAGWDVVVVGAGAAGLMAAIAAAEAGARVLLLEKNKRPGVKILMSGGTRCNITHACDDRGIVEAYGPPGRFLHSALAAFGVEDAIAFFEAEGVATKVEEGGKVFPLSNRAADVLAALLARLERSGATLGVEEAVQGIEPGFLVQTARRELQARRVIVTTGGLSYPGSGTTGDGYAWAQRFGHGLVPTRPALVPITTSALWVPGLRGLSVADTEARIIDGEKVLARRRGALLFAHFGLSGPVALDVSRAVASHPTPASLALEADLLPGKTLADLEGWLRQEASASGKKQVSVLLSQWLPRRLGDAVMALAGVPQERRAASLEREERARLASTCKRLRIPVTGTMGYGRAEVTAGGIPLDEVDSRTMESRKQPGLYLAGEVLDLDGPIGGYNFQAAWSTGWLAGTKAAAAGRIPTHPGGSS
jgi:predicted Rossmann fold flavoprotein